MSVFPGVPDGVVDVEVLLAVVCPKIKHEKVYDFQLSSKRSFITSPFNKHRLLRTLYLYYVVY